MKTKVLGLGVATLGVAALAFALSGDKLAGHAAAVNKAEGLSVKLSANTVGGARMAYSIDVAKPNKFRIETPTSIVVSNGTEMVTFMKGMNAYYRDQADAKMIADAFSMDVLLPYKPFFDANAFSKFTSVKANGTATRKGETFDAVSANIGAGKSLNVFLSTKDGVARHFEIVEKKGSKETITIVDGSTVSLSKPNDSVFEFKAPSGAKEVSKADLMESKWYYDLAEAKQVAAQTKRPIMLDFYTDWCFYCKKLDNEVFNTEAFKEKAKNFVLCKINPEKDPGGTFGYEVEGFPAIFFIDAEGKVIHQIGGFAPVDVFVAEMDKAIGK